MSPGKYYIMWADYPFNGFWDGSYSTDWFLPFLVHLARAVVAHPIVDVRVRDTERMG